MRVKRTMRINELDVMQHRDLRSAVKKAIVKSGLSDVSVRQVTEAADFHSPYKHYFVDIEGDLPPPKLSHSVIIERRMRKLVG